MRLSLRVKAESHSKWTFVGQCTLRQERLKMRQLVRITSARDAALDDAIRGWGATPRIGGEVSALVSLSRRTPSAIK